MRSILLLFILLIVSEFAIAQGQDDNIDSLVAVAESYVPDSDTAGLFYSQMGEKLAYIRPQDAIKFLKKAVDCHTRSQNYRQLCFDNSFIGICYAQMGNFEHSFEFFNIQRLIAKDHGITDEYVWANNNIGYSYLILRNPDMARPYLMEAFNQAPCLHSSKVDHNLLSNLGWMYMQSSQFDSAIVCYNKALQIRLDTEDAPVMVAASYRDIGNVYYYSGNHDEALIYFRKSEMYNDTLASDISADINSHLANIYLKRLRLDSAYYCAHKAIRMAGRFRNMFILRYSYGVLGDIHSELGNFREAERAYYTQILYNDTMASASSMKTIYESEFNKEVERQSSDILKVDKRMRVNVIGIIVLVIILAIVLWLVNRMLKRRKIIQILTDDVTEYAILQDQSLKYTQRIQKAVLPDFDKMMPECDQKFLLFRPRHLVSSNFFWHFGNPRYYMVAIGVCGIPDIKAACITMMASSLLYEAASFANDPTSILWYVRERMMKMIRGFDMGTIYAAKSDVSMAVIDRVTKKMSILCVKNPLVIFRDGERIVLNAGVDTSVNYFNTKEFYTHELQLKEGDKIYCMSEGYARQTGGPKNEEFSQSRLLDLLSEIYEKPMEEQSQILEKSFDQWRGHRDQESDIMISGFRIGTLEILND